MKVAIGCPVSNRAWILPSWFSHVENACSVAGVDPHYVFIVGTSNDNTEDVIERYSAKRDNTVIFVDEDQNSGQDRNWNKYRYRLMVDVRNQLLNTVRSTDTDLFLSVDSDILLHHEAILRLIGLLTDDYWAVGGKVYLTPPPQSVPNYAILRNGSMHRPDSESTFPVHALMALKLMSKKAYNVDYSLNSLGEDLGWSQDIREAGGKMLWDGLVVSKHVMQKSLLGKEDPRLGW